MNEIDHNETVWLRHQLHAMAEVSGKEDRTSTFLKSYLSEHASGRLLRITDTGFVWAIETGHPGPNVLFRAELDALPIAEINAVHYRSTDPGVSHMCGHDGHMAILVGTIMSLTLNPPEEGNYYFLFQPAEETGQGAAQILASPKFDLALDFVFALHNLPGYPIGNVYCKAGSFNAAVTSMIIRFIGKTSHAAEPENGNNPALAIASTLQLAKELQHLDTGDANFNLITPVFMEMGERAYGVSAGQGEVHFTLRAWTNEHLNTIKERLTHEVNRMAEQDGLSVAFESLESFAATNNDAEAVKLIARAAGEAQQPYHAISQPFKWGEDFGLFMEKYKGGFFGLGAGEQVPALHNPDYNFPDELIPIGVSLFTSLIRLIEDNASLSKPTVTLQ